MTRHAVRAFRVAPSLVLALALGGARTLAAQKVTLRLRPQPGDTIQMRMDQVTEMTGVRRDVDSTATVTGRTRVAARAIVRRLDGDAAIVLAITDSVEATGQNRASGDRLRRQMLGRPVTVRVSADGSMELEGDAANAPAELRGIFTSMPPTLPRTPVAVGETWHRTMPVPAFAAGDARAPGMIRAVFTLDSLSRDGEVAFVSLRASLTREAPPNTVPPGARFVTTSMLTGTLQVDRKRGWMTDSRTTVSVHSVATPPPGSSEEPIHFRMKITQWLRAVGGPPRN